MAYLIKITKDICLTEMCTYLRLRLEFGYKFIKINNLTVMREKEES